MEYGVKQSIGIDVDPNIVQKAIDRLQRIHPQPNIQFVVENLMDPTGQAWKDHVPCATILTMYFANDGLQQIRRLLEQSLRGKRCKIYTCGYAMPGWESQMVETVLDMPIYFYDWGNPNIDLFRPESYVDELPRGGNDGGNGMALPHSRDPYMRKNSNKQSMYQPNPLPGFHPDDLKDYGWDEFGPSNNHDSADNEEKKQTK
jgi:hypothetical protein